MPSNPRLQEAVDLVRERWFPDLPIIKARIANPSDSLYLRCDGWYEGNYRIVIHPDTLSSDFKLEDTIKHELTHAWVDTFGKRDEETQGHGEDFLKKAIELKLDLSATFKKHPKSKLIYERITGTKVGMTYTIQGPSTLRLPKPPPNRPSVDIIARTRPIRVRPEPRPPSGIQLTYERSRQRAQEAQKPRISFFSILFQFLFGLFLFAVGLVFALVLIALFVNRSMISAWKDEGPMFFMFIIVFLGTIAWFGLYSGTLYLRNAFVGEE
jgi:hypothetical protein